MNFIVKISDFSSPLIVMYCFTAQIEVTLEMSLTGQATTTEIENNLITVVSILA